MKKWFLDNCMKIVKNNNPNMDNERLEIIKYGLEGIYLTITKTIVVFTICIILGIFKEMLIMLLVFNILRTTGFGIHAKKSWQCMISSIIIFCFLPFVAKYLYIEKSIKIILGIISVILIYIYAPADTIKRPLVNKRKREIWKFITTINSIVLATLSIYISDNTVSNLFIFGIYTEVIMINPITYKIFDLPYNNYLNYGLNSNV